VSSAAMPRAISRTRLELVALQPGEWLAVTPTRVHVRAEGRPDTLRWGPNDYRLTNGFFNRLQQVRVGDTPLLELVSYRGVSMWQFLPSYVWPEVFRAVELVEIIAGVLEEAEPELYEAEPSADTAAAIWEGVVRAAGIALADDGARSVRGERRSARAFAGAMRRKLRRRPTPRWPPTAGGGVLMGTLGERHWVPRPGSGEYYDEQFSPLIPALRAQGWTTIRLIDCQELPMDSICGRHLDGADWYLPGISPAPVERGVHLYFAGIWESLCGDEGFREAFSHRGISLLPALEPIFRRAFRETLPVCVGYLAGAASILDAVRPEAVVVTYETGPRQRALTIEAARRSIPTIGLMHGMIYDTHYDYMHEGVTTDPFGCPASFTVPLVTCVWGEFWRDVLTRSGSYPSEAVVVTGNPRMNDVLALSRRFGRSEMRDRLDLPPGGRVVLLLTANQRAGEFLSACLEALNEHSDCVPLVKPHPSDDIQLIATKLRESGYGEESLQTDNLADAILAADLVVSQPSTAALEAMLLRRPLVLVNLDRTAGFAEPVGRTGLARYAETPEELAREIAAALAVGDFERRSETAYRAFVEEWFGEDADELSAERVARVITQLARMHPLIP